MLPENSLIAIELLDNSPDAMMALSPERTVVYWNKGAENTFGYRRDEAIGRKLTELIIPANRVAEEETFFNEMMAAGHSTFESIRRRKDGSLIPVDISTRVILDDQGLVKYILSSKKDITNRKLAEEDLRQTNQRLERALAELLTKTQELATTTQQLWQASKLATMGELAASVAHELNNALATISLHSEMLLGQIAEGDPNRRSLLVIEQEVDRMATLVSNLLLFSRRGSRQIVTLDICEELENSLNFIQYHLRSHNVDIVNDCTTVLPTVEADRQQLHQVFLNLITNASDAMPNGGRLTVRSRVGAAADGLPAVVIEFSDTGTGVQTSDLPKLWEPFFTTKPEGKGTGLGLAICRRIVEEHRGAIEIETGPGKGATVRITLPATDQGVEVAA